MLRSEHPNFVTTIEMHMLNMCPRISVLRRTQLSMYASTSGFDLLLHMNR